MNRGITLSRGAVLGNMEGPVSRALARHYTQRNDAVNLLGRSETHFELMFDRGMKVLGRIPWGRIPPCRFLSPITFFL